MATTRANSESKSVVDIVDPPSSHDTASQGDLTASIVHNRLRAKVGPVGEYGWSGAWSTYFWVDPSEELFGILMLQLEPPDFGYGKVLQSLAYQALVA